MYEGTDTVLCLPQPTYPNATPAVAHENYSALLQIGRPSRDPSTTPSSRPLPFSYFIFLLFSYGLRNKHLRLPGEQLHSHVRRTKRRR